MDTEVVVKQAPGVLETSPDLSDFWKAYIPMQADLQPVARDMVRPKGNSRYATLDSLIETIRPILAKHGFGFIQPLSTVGTDMVLTTMLVHESGQWLSSTVVVPIVSVPATNEAQQRGAGITYMRRYTLASLLGLATEEDTDGALPGAPPQSTPRPRQAQTSQQTASSGDSAEPTFVTNVMEIRQASNDKRYQQFGVENKAAWWRGADALAQEAPWIGLGFTSSQLHDVGQRYEIPKTRVVCEFDDKGYRDIQRFEYADNPQKMQAQWARLEQQAMDYDEKLRVPAIPPRTDPVVMAQAALLLKTALHGLDQGRPVDAAQSWLDGKLQETGVIDAITVPDVSGDKEEREKHNPLNIDRPTTDDGMPF